MVFSVLVATVYYQPSPDSPVYDHRVRLIRAYPTHRADAYELLVLDSGVLPDVIVSDSSAAILSMATRLRKFNPNLIWVPSAYHVSNQLLKALGKMRRGKPSVAFIPGDLDDRLNDYTYLGSLEAWEEWWDDLAAAATPSRSPKRCIPASGATGTSLPSRTALTYLELYPGTPRGNGAVEAAIRGQVKPFFESRVASFTNIERSNRAADLLTPSTERPDGQQGTHREPTATLKQPPGTCHQHATSPNPRRPGS